MPTIWVRQKRNFRDGVYLAIAPSLLCPPQIKSDNGRREEVLSSSSRFPSGCVFRAVVPEKKKKEEKHPAARRNRGVTAERNGISIYYVISRNDTEYLGEPSELSWNSKGRLNRLIRLIPLSHNQSRDYENRRRWESENSCILFNPMNYTMRLRCALFEERYENLPRRFLARGYQFRKLASPAPPEITVHIRSPIVFPSVQSGVRKRELITHAGERSRSEVRRNGEAKPAPLESKEAAVAESESRRTGA